MRDLLFCFVLLAVQTTAEGNDGLQIDASLAFGGIVSSESLTELRVSAISEVDATLTVETRGASPDVTFQIYLVAGERATGTAPIGLRRSESPPRIFASLGDGQRVSQALKITAGTRARSALVGDLPIRVLSELSGTAAHGTVALPEIAQAYNQISILTIDGPALAQLNDAQLRALLEFAGNCGRILLIDVAEPVLRIFSSRASCSQRFVLALTSEQDVVAAHNDLLKQQPGALPSLPQLENLLHASASREPHFGRITSFLLVYFAVLIALLSRRRTRAAAVGFCLLGTALVVLVWPDKTSSAFVAWSETGVRDRVARYTGLEQHRAARRGNFIIPGDSFAGNAERVIASNFINQWDARPGADQLLWRASPLEQLDKFSRGSFAVDDIFDIAINGELAQVCNRGAGLSRQAFLYWGGEFYEIPEMQPGEKWSSSESMPLSAADSSTPELALLRRRSPDDTASLLQALPVSSTRQQTFAWLLRRQLAGNRSSSCAT